MLIKKYQPDIGVVKKSSDYVIEEGSCGTGPAAVSACAGDQSTTMFFLGGRSPE